MNRNIDELLAKIRELQDELEEQYRQTREEWAQKKVELAEEFLRQQRRYKTGLFRFLLRTRFLVALTAPVIYMGWIPFLLMDLFVTIYQTICFPVYRIPRVKRRDYIVFDREDLPYLNLIEKINCAYCSYGNGLVAYAREVVGRTEQYWCPIKHARKTLQAHPYYTGFLDFGDAQGYKNELEKLRQQLQHLPTETTTRPNT